MDLKRNTLANYFGQGWLAFMNIAFVPLYIKYLGVEAYGLIGFYALLQAWFTLLDIGLTPTLNREMARYTAGAYHDYSIRDLVRSLEVISYTFAFLTIFIVALAANWLSIHWLSSNYIPIDLLSKVIAIIGICIALRLVEGLYKSAIIGLQQQVILNIFNALLATIRFGGAVVILAWVSPTIQAYFLWQGLVSILTIIIFTCLTYRILPKINRHAKFSFVELKKIWAYAGSILATTLVVLILVQVDKLVLSKVLSLENFGYYTLAGSVVGILYALTTPITQAYFPIFSKMVVVDDVDKLTTLYHQGTQLVSVLVIPAALMLIFFGDNILMLWTGNVNLVEHVNPILKILAIGTMLNCLMYIPYQLTLAYGWPEFALKQNVIALIFLVPAILWAAPSYGAIGVASIWTLLNSGYILISMHFIHKRLLHKELSYWYLYDVTVPAIAASTAAIVLRILEPTIDTTYIKFLWILFCGVTITFLACAASPLIRQKALLKNIFKGT